MSDSPSFSIRRRVLHALIALLVAIAPAYGAGGKDGLWCLARLLDKDPLASVGSDFAPMTDLMDPAAIRAAVEAVQPPLRATQGMSEKERVELLKRFPIERITAAPGHLFLRNPKQLANLKSYIAGSAGGDFSRDPLLFNLITDESGAILSIDLWNAHHRLVAYLEAGYHFLGEIPDRNFKILVNGVTSEGEPTWPHYLSVAGIDETKGIPLNPIPPGGDIRVGTVGVDGRYANFTLGSRNTMAQLRRNMLHRKQPKIGVFFGTFDPPHAGHLYVVREAIAKLGLDEAVLVPNPTPVHKPGASSLLNRVEMVARAIRGEPKINVYLADSGVIINAFGREPFFERMAQTYGTHEIFQIVGEDSFTKLLGEGALNKGRKYAVVSRPSQRVGGQAELLVPEEWKSNVFVLADDGRSLSSTTVRNLIKSGASIDPEVLEPEVLEYIRMNKLYRPK